MQQWPSIEEAPLKGLEVPSQPPLVFFSFLPLSFYPKSYCPFFASRKSCAESPKQNSPPKGLAVMVQTASSYSLWLEIARCSKFQLPKPKEKV